ncbi:MAG: ATP phosphoribosyltransferase regulatory subunit [Christensenellales bacterium]
MIVTAVEALSRCVPNFRLELGHAGFFRALAAQLPIDDDLREDIRSTIESKNYAALNTILDKLEMVVRLMRCAGCRVYSAAKRSLRRLRRSVAMMRLVRRWLIYMSCTARW